MAIGYNELSRRIKEELNNFINNKNWKEFLLSSAYNYKYSFIEQLSIFSQNPQAKACAEYGFWVNKINRYIRKGEKAISIIDNKNNAIKYLFDISQTGSIYKNNEDKNKLLWELKGNELEILYNKNDYINDFLRDTTKIISNNIKENYGSVENDFIINSVLYKTAMRLNINDKLEIEKIDVPGNLTQSDLIKLGNKINIISMETISHYRNEIRRVENERKEVGQLCREETQLSRNVRKSKDRETLQRTEEIGTVGAIPGRGTEIDQRNLQSGTGKIEEEMGDKRNFEAKGSGNLQEKVKTSRDDSRRDSKEHDIQLNRNHKEANEKQASFFDVEKPEKKDDLNSGIISESSNEVYIKQALSYMKNSEKLKEKIILASNEKEINSIIFSAVNLSIVNTNNTYGTKPEFLNDTITFINTRKKITDDIKNYFNKMLENREIENYWIIDFNEDLKLIEKDYTGQKLTRELLDEIKLKDEEVKVYNKTVGEDKYGEKTDEWAGYSKFNFNHIVNGKIEESLRIDIGDGNEINERYFKYLYEQIEINNKIIEKNEYIPNKSLLDMDLDNDGVIDRYDADPRDGSVQDLEDLEDRGVKSFAYKETIDKKLEDNYEKNIKKEVTNIAGSSITSPITDEMFWQMQNYKEKQKEQKILTPKERYKENYEAIRLLKDLEFENRNIREDEKNILLKYSGFGAIPELFDENKNNWNKERAEIKELLKDSEYKSLENSILNSHYTDENIISFMYKVLYKFGLKEGKILEPSMGKGNFLNEAPKKFEFYGVELDEITGRIAKKLYPNANIQIKGFEKTNFKNSSFDAAIGNVPFGNYNVFDKDYPNNKFLIHDYFINKSLDKVRDGGIVAFITSSGTMDKKDDSFRKEISKKADLIGAIRLPNNAFKSAGTQVVSDILFFQKKEDKIPVFNEEWLTVSQINGQSINNYFKNNLDMVLGDIKAVSGRFGEELTVEPFKDKELKKLLKDSLNKFPENIYEKSINELDLLIEGTENIPIGTYGIINNKVFYNTYDNKLKEIKSKNNEALKEMILMRNTLRDLYKEELNDADINNIKKLQEDLSKKYDNFVEKYGLINNKENVKLFDKDNSIAILKSLENFDKDGNFLGKSEVFSEIVIQKNTFPDKANNVIEALAISLNNKAEVDIKYISELVNKDEKDVLNELVDKREVFLDLDTKKYIAKNEYLSGDVKSKLEKLLDLDIDSIKAYSLNIEELKKVIPKDIEAKDISFRLGSTWIPSKYVCEFMRETFDMKYTNLEVEFSQETSKWHIPNKNDRFEIQLSTKFGTNRLNALHIMEKTLNLNENIKILDTHYDLDGNPIRVLNKKETLLVSKKQEFLKEEFKNWLFKDEKRKLYLVNLYNKKFNRIVPRTYDGSNLLYNGISKNIELRKHQKDVVARAVFGGNTLVAHEVGAGKTFSAIAAVMESKRIGLHNKAMIVVPNHITEQWGGDFINLYPNAKILVAKKDDFIKENRQAFFGKIANNNFDAVIIGHSQLPMIPLAKETQERFMEEEIEELREKINSLSKYDISFSKKQLIQQEKKLSAKLEKLLSDNTKDKNVVTFEEMGIDKLIIDEAHEFKNLQVTTSLNNVSGISVSASKKSFDLYTKCRYLDEKTNNKGLIFLTGTPLSNSMSELYIMQKYLQHELLEDKELLNFDAWISNFGDIKNSIELKPEGTGYQMKTKFSKFNNVPELITMFREVADIKTSKDLNLNIPKSERIVVETEPSQTQKEILEQLSKRADSVRAGLDNKIDNMLVITNDGKKLALDQRLLNPILKDEENSKLNKCVENIQKIYIDTKENKLTQVVFCDISTPNNKEFNVYDDIKGKLINKGIKKEEIAFIHDAKNEKDKEKIFEKLNKGEIRILLGSTRMMGTGTNIQNRLFAIHHLDCPWRPADREQRNGRMIRQGNRNKEVIEFTYITKGTFDAYLYQLLENKQKFISQVMDNDKSLRVAEDVDESVLTYAEIKALCTDNPIIKEKMELENDINKIQIEKNAFLDNKEKLSELINKVYPERIDSLDTDIKNLEKDNININKNNNNDNIYIQGKEYENKEEAGQSMMNIIKEKGLTNGKIGSYKNIDLYVDFNPSTIRYSLILKGNYDYKIDLGDSNRGNIMRIENKLKDIPQIIDKKREHLGQIKKDYETAKIQLNENFDKDVEYLSKIQRLKEINFTLNNMNNNDIVDKDIWIEEAKEIIIDKAEELGDYADLNLENLDDMNFYKNKVLNDVLEININLSEYKLITKINSEIIDVEEKQSLEDFIKFVLKPLDVKEKINKLISNDKLKDIELDMNAIDNLFDKNKGDLSL